MNSFSLKCQNELFWSCCERGLDEAVVFKDKEPAIKCQVHYLLACTSWANYSATVPSPKDEDNTTCYIAGSIQRINEVKNVLELRILKFQPPK